MGEFEVAAERARRRVDVTMSGFLSDDQVASVSRSLNEAERAVCAYGDRYDMLLDLRGFVPQAQSSVLALQQLVNGSPYRADRIAVVLHSAIVKLQLRRILPRKDLAYFEHARDALNWLDG